MNITSKAIISFVIALATPLALACNYPHRPDDLPDGTTASKVEMLAGVEIVAKYQEAMKGYLSCMEADQIVASQAVDESGEETRQQSSDLFNKKYNAAVEEQTLVVEEFNAQIRSFKEKSK